MSSLVNNFFLVIAIIMAVSGLPAFIFTFQITKSWQQSLIIAVLCEIAALTASFFSKIWQRLESQWTIRLADWIDSQAQSILSGYQRQYNNYVVYQYRAFDVKGFATQGPFNLDLEKVFVELSVKPTPLHQTTVNMLKTFPEKLQSGRHSIWEYLNTKTTATKNYAIIGPPGCGKTTLLKFIALTLVSSYSRRRKVNAPNRLPILLFLRDHADEICSNADTQLVKLIRAQLVKRQVPAPPDGWLEKKLAHGKCLIMFDGLDEVVDENTRKSVVQWVEKCAFAYGKNRFLITSRPNGYRDNPLDGFSVLEVRSFTRKQVQRFVHNWYLANEIMSSQRDDSGVHIDAKVGANDLLKRINETPALTDLAVNPLLLTMIATVHRYRSSLPGRRVELYSEICEVFLGKRRQARGIKSELTPAQIQCVLRPLACYLMAHQKRELPLLEILEVIDPPLRSVNPNTDGKAFLEMVENTSGLLLERESNYYGFAHLTFQEYLASVFIIEKHLEKLLIERINNPWWHETIRLYCAQTDASAVIEACMNSREHSIATLILLVECMDEARQVRPETRQQYQVLMDEGVEDPDPVRRGIFAEALFKIRLGEADNLYTNDATDKR